IALLLQCVFITSRKMDKIAIYMIHMMIKLRKISATYQYNKTKLVSKKRLYLIGCEDFWNLGDHHIAISEIEYLRSIFPEHSIVEITASRYFAVNRLLPFVIRKEDLICMHGGGNIGNFYMLAEYIRRDIMKKFRNNEKVIFPQTIHYDCSDVGKAELEKDQISIKKTNNLTICVRERYSFELAKQYFDCKVVLTPDIVLFSDYTKRYNYERKGATLLIRNDLESVISEQDKRLIKEVAQQFTSEVRINDTQLIIDIKVADRNEVMDDFISKIAKAEFVITDRLHGMVFCAITKTPCIVLPNYNHKVAGVYDWISKLDYIIMIKTMSELEEAVKKLQLIKKVEYDNSIILEGFDVLSKLLKSKVK
ncbi:MAG: glycosyl transferase family 2, partial [Herbinix sp.]|nr:glycosyl transferase family 2 [Herbinix sp.]